MKGNFCFYMTKVRIDGKEYEVPDEVASELVFLRALAREWERDARMYAARLAEILPSPKPPDPR